MSQSNTTAQDWEIESFGPAQIPNPCPCVSYVEDDVCLLLDPRIHTHHTESRSPDIATIPTCIERAGPRKEIFFNPKEVVAGVVTCGGLCPALNNVIRAVVNCLHFRYGVKKVIGFRYGFEGLIPETSSIIELTPFVVRDIHQFGGSILGSSRGPQDIGKMVDYLVSLGVNVLFTLGGDGTQRGSRAIANEIHRRGLHISVVGVPKTIDNDISYVERTFGFETAVEMAQASIIAAHEEARSARNGIGIVKLMGRESGFIALQASLASGDVNLLLLPEMSFSMDAIVRFVLERFTERSHCVIVVSEGAGQELCAPASGLGKDISGNHIFADIGQWLKKELGNRLKQLDVEHTIKYIDPSYAIRSAVAISSDAVFALQLGQMAVHAAMAGRTNMIVGCLHNQFVHVPISKATAFRKKVDIKGAAFQSFLDSSGMPVDLVQAHLGPPVASPRRTPTPAVDVPRAVV
ncbi:diphosphate--fructose-6-phosphate 1-phosphotransferase [Polychytrium aggregatum]|uniref:diphosphate--fructose-6-phosphate 1-phosphotransferase n=1 Tax=Polychytrium aggregatum TaxID=110093 RepID=UPI0022FF1E63|nr:diphosphate--fructose-6-phosphate 1-phosphotransferase [Polychytrium aggregatum]KAI9204914.1 diphosphate--fructose-6-phosphate 1-phosphotransferase [Polychytrium aggregatum]